MSSIGDRAIQHHHQGHEASCEYALTSYMFIFGIIQIIASQIPNFHSTKWLSVTAAVTSFMYSLIGSGLGLAKTLGMELLIPVFKGMESLIPTLKAMQEMEKLKVA